MLAVALVQKQLRLVLVLAGPLGALGPVVLPVLFALPAAGHGRRQARVVLADGVVAAGRDELPDEGLDVVVAAVALQAVQQRQPDRVLDRDIIFQVAQRKDKARISMILSVN